MVPLGHYLILSAILFATGTMGVFLRRNVITVLLSIEVMLNAVNPRVHRLRPHPGVGRRPGHHVLRRHGGRGGSGNRGWRWSSRSSGHRESLNPDVFTSLKW